MAPRASDDGPERRYKALVDELARVLWDGDQAKVLVLRAGFPSHHVPEFKTPLTFWTVVVGAADGRVPGGVQAIVDEAAAQFPGSVFLASYRVEAVGPRRQDPARPKRPPTTESPHDPSLDRETDAPGERARRAHERRPPSPRPAATPDPWWKTSLIITAIVLVLVAVAVYAPWPINGLAVLGALVYLLLTLNNPELWLRNLAKGCVAAATAMAVAPSVRVMFNLEWISGGFNNDNEYTLGFLVAGMAFAGLDVWREQARHRSAVAPREDRRDEIETASVDDHPGLVSAKELQTYREAVRACHGHTHFVGLPSRAGVGVSWEDLYVDLTMEDDPGLTERELFHQQGRRAPEKVHLADAFRRARASNMRAMVLLGQPGSGKTTQLRQMLLRALDESEGPQSLGLPKGTIAVFVALRDLKLPRHAADGSVGEIDLEAVLRQAMTKRLTGISDELAGRILASPGALLLLDGLDEIPDRAQRAAVSKAIARVQEGGLAACHMLVSSRYAGYVDAARLNSRFLELRLRALEDDEVERLVCRWHDAVEDVDANKGERPPSRERAAAQSRALLEHLRDATRRADGRLSEVARTPLLLTAMCLIHRDKGLLPHDAGELYEQCEQIMLERWRKEEKGFEPTLNAKLARRVLEPVAYWLHGEQERIYANVDELRAPVEEGLRAVDHAHVGAEEFLGTFTNESGLLTQWGPELYGFIHLAFQEHLTALALRECWERGSATELEALAERFGEEWWREVILLMLAKGGAGLFERFMGLVVRQPRFVEWSRTRLMGRCLRESQGVSATPFMEVLRTQAAEEKRLVATARLLVEVMPTADGLEALLGEHPVAAVQGVWHVHARRGDTVPVVTSARGGVELVLVPGGRFLMGSAEDDELAFSNERPQHEVELASFYLARTPVTNAQYREYMTANPGVKEPEYWGNGRYNQDAQPVVGVSWHEAKAYCDWAGLSLPTEAQWEYACRAGTTTRYWSGDEEEDLARVGWYGGNSDGRLHAVKELEPNAWGLYDMHGNIDEWCEDAFGDYKREPRADDGLRHEPVGGAIRVMRGGVFGLVARFARSACRGYGEPVSRWSYLGFRPAQGHHQ